MVPLIRNSTPVPGKCHGELDECRQRLRVARAELHKIGSWMESRALRLDGVLDELDEFLDGPPKAKGARGANGVLHKFKARQRADGDFDIYLDDRAPFQLPPMLARLLVLLAEDGGREAGDALVGFKSRNYLLTALAASTSTHNGNYAVGRPARLRQAILTLRARLGRVVNGGAQLVQTRRNVGFRLVLRRPEQR